MSKRHEKDTPVETDITKIIRAAATDAGNRWMRNHPETKTEGTAAWTRDAYNAAAAEFHRLCRDLGLDPFKMR